MALVRSALEVGPYAIGDDEEGEEHGDIPGTPSLATSDEAIDELQRLDHAHSASRLVQPPVSRTAPGQAISREMAYRVMRDAVVEAPPTLLDDLREVRYIEQFSLLARAAARRRACSPPARR